MSEGYPFQPSGPGAWMLRPDLQNTPQVPFPVGFGVRGLRPDEGPLWTDIIRDAEEYFSIGEEIFARTFGVDPDSIPQRCYVITGPKGNGVGVISAWYDRDFKGGDWGRIHWVATRPTYQGRGLGKAGLSYALNQLARWHTRAYLDTQTARLPAIKMYLDFGFVPDFDQKDAREAWRDVKAKLTHPTLEALDL
jgi:GNAT superfamily N-acetyltransferase